MNDAKPLHPCCAEITNTPNDGEIAHFIALSRDVPGWTRDPDATELARVSFRQPPEAVIVEIGSFLGSSTILLAGPRRLAGSGKVHCVDPFDGSGDHFSVPYYRRILAELGVGSPRDHFDRNIRGAGLGDWVEAHPGRAVEIAAKWRLQIDLLYLDGDQSRQGAQEAYDSWSPFLKVGGVIALHNSHPDNHTLGHDGHRSLVESVIGLPRYKEIRRIGATTFARRT